MTTLDAVAGGDRTGGGDGGGPAPLARPVPRGRRPRRGVVLLAALLAGCTASPGAPPTADGPAASADASASPGARASTSAVAGDDGALLAGLEVAEEAAEGRYDRASFDYPAGGTDSRGCNTRALVLMRDSVDPPQVAYPTCRVLAGRWVDPFDGGAYSDPTQVSIDHVVSLSEAWRSGASRWSAERRRAFANDARHPDPLAVIGGPGNASKGDKDPASWLPADPSRRVEYARRWVRIKLRWRLTADRREVDALRSVLEGVRAEAPAGPSSTASAAPQEPAGAEPHYRTCAEARAAGRAPLRSGEPGYRPALDRDGDGVACE